MLDNFHRCPVEQNGSDCRQAIHYVRWSGLFDRRAVENTTRHQIHCLKTVSRPRHDSWLTIITVCECLSAAMCSCMCACVRVVVCSVCGWTTVYTEVELIAAIHSTMSHWPILETSSSTASRRGRSSDIISVIVHYLRSTRLRDTTASWYMLNACSETDYSVVSLN